MVNQKKKKKTLELEIYNSMSKKKEVFKSNIPGKVSMDVCGITAYDFSHLGHASAAVSFDLLFRYLQHLGYGVTYLRNFTDIDYKMVCRANELGEDPLSLSSRFCQEYMVELAELQRLEATHRPRVIDHMEQINDLISQIMQNGFAYTMDRDVVFSRDKLQNYGQLSGQNLANNRTGGWVDVDARKHNPADFVLWKAAKPGEPKLGEPVGSW